MHPPRRKTVLLMTLVVLGQSANVLQASLLKKTAVAAAGTMQDGDSR